MIIHQELELIPLIPIFPVNRKNEAAWTAETRKQSEAKHWLLNCSSRFLANFVGTSALSGKNQVLSKGVV